MAKHITVLIRDAALCERMGLRNARKIAEFYALPVIANGVGELYRKLSSGLDGCSVAGRESLSESALPRLKRG